MDLGTIIIGIVMLALCVLPFLLMHINRKKNQEQLLFSISKMVSNEGGKLSTYDAITNAIIGLDSVQNKAFMYRKHKDRETREFISLSDFQKCEMVKTMKSGQNVNDSIIDKLELKFIPKLHSTKPVAWEFYNSDESFGLNDELDFVKRSAEKINNQLTISRQN